MENWIRKQDQRDAAKTIKDIGPWGRGTYLTRYRLRSLGAPGVPRTSHQTGEDWPAGRIRHAMDGGGGLEESPMRVRSLRDSLRRGLVATGSGPAHGLWPSGFQAGRQPSALATTGSTGW